MYTNKIDCTYLPIINEVNDINVQELNEAYNFSIKHKFRSFCTYHYLIPWLTTTSPTMKLCTVIDFPNGKNHVSKKIYDIGQSYELCKVSNSFEVDVVVNPISSKIDYELDAFKELQHEHFNIKYIIGLGFRPNKEIIHIVSKLNLMNNAIVKTNTGREGIVSFNEKLQSVRWLSSFSNNPIKIAGGITRMQEIVSYNWDLNRKDELIFGVSYNKLKTWKEYSDETI